MEFDMLRKVQDEIEQIKGTYEIFNEDTRLSYSKAARVEFITTVNYIEKYLKNGDRILDIGAGCGEYSIYFARKGHEVVAVELAEANIAAFEKKISPEDSIRLMQGNAVDLGMLGEEKFDIVLLLGPLYHMHTEADRKRCIEQAKAHCADGGKIFFAFISNDMVILTELIYNEKYFLTDDYDHDTFKLVDFPFVFHTVDECRRILRDGKINVIHEVASDGVSELMAERINAMDEESYGQYLKYHMYVCEKPEMLGRSNHLLFVGEKI